MVKIFPYYIPVSTRIFQRRIILIIIILRCQDDRHSIGIFPAQWNSSIYINLAQFIRIIDHIFRSQVLDRKFHGGPIVPHGFQVKTLLNGPLEVIGQVNIHRKIILVTHDRNLNVHIIPGVEGRKTDFASKIRSSEIPILRDGHLHRFGESFTYILYSYGQANNFIFRDIMCIKIIGNRKICNNHIGRDHRCCAHLKQVGFFQGYFFSRRDDKLKFVFTGSNLQRPLHTDIDELYPSCFQGIQYDWIADHKMLVGLFRKYRRNNIMCRALAIIKQCKLDRAGL